MIRVVPFCPKNYFALILLLLPSILAFGQGSIPNGPGGVGSSDGTSSLKLWYRPDNGVTAGTTVSAWQNSAGVSALDMVANGSAQPTLNVGAINGYDEISFDGGDYMQITGALSSSNFISNQASSFVVSQRSATTASWVYATSPHQINRFSCHISWSNNNVYFDIGNCCSSYARIQVGGLTGLNNYSIWSYDALSSTGKQLYRDGVLLQSRPNTRTYTSYATQTFRLGENFNGNIAEVIIFNQKVNTAQRLIIENYLAAKYGHSNMANDFYSADEVANGNYDHDVAGIGRVDASNIHSDAQGTGMVRILNPTDLNNDEFLMWGHNNGLAQAMNVVDIPGPIQARFDRVWRISEVSSSGVARDVGEVDMRWDLSALGAITASDLRLIVDTDNDGLFSDETPVGGASDLGGGIYEFLGVSAIANNLRFTLGTINRTNTPLPVELLSFEANVNGDKVDLKWVTTSEINNDYFTVERSTDAKKWKKIVDVSGAGNIDVLLEYYEVDYKPVVGISYYRLKQTNFDGSYKYSNIAPVRFKLNKVREGAISLFPNPVNRGEDVRLEYQSINETELLVVLRNTKGQEYYSKVIINVEDGKLIALPIGRKVPPGVYLVTASSKNQIHSEKLIIK